MHVLPMSGQARAWPPGQSFQAEFLDNVRCFHMACVNRSVSSPASGNFHVADVRGDLISRKERKKRIQRAGIALQNLTTLTLSQGAQHTCNVTKHQRTRRYVIADFIREFGVRAADFDTSCVGPARKSCSEDDYFSRKLSAANLVFLAKQLSQLTNQFVLFSPASSRAMFGSFARLKASHIRGKRTTVGAILEHSNIPVDNKNQWFVLISRLTPVDYHRVHSPVAGKIASITAIKSRQSSAYSVDPTIVRNSSIDVFVHNRRIVLTIEVLDPDTKRVLGPTVYVVIVGATCVNSIQLSNLRVHQLLRVGDELAAFHFGGSTVLTLFVPPYPDTVGQKTHKSLIANLAQKHETYFEVGAPILAK